MRRGYTPLDSCREWPYQDFDWVHVHALPINVPQTKGLDKGTQHTARQWVLHEVYGFDLEVVELLTPEHASQILVRLKSETIPPNELGEPNATV